ncbi:pilin [Marinobacterium sp. OS208]|nr:pilin [Marinobacterium sedimentorum]
MKVSAQEYYASNGICPDNTTAASATEAAIDLNTNLNGSYVSQVDVEESASAGICIFTATYLATGVAAKIAGETLIVAGDMNAGSEVDWRCDDSLIPEASTLLAANPEVAPSACRP